MKVGDLEGELSQPSNVISEYSVMGRPLLVSTLISESLVYTLTKTLLHMCAEG